MNYIEVSLSEGDLDFLLEVLENNLEVTQESKDPEAAQVSRVLMRLVTSLNLQMINAQGNLGTLSSH